MYEKLLQRLNQIIPLNPQQRNDLRCVLQPVNLAKGSFLLEKGQIADHIYFVLQGVIRSFCEVEKKEVTRWFGIEGHFATSYFSFVYRQASEDSIILETDSQLLAMSYNSLQALARQDIVWIDLNRRLLEYYYTGLMERVMALQTQSAAERYQSFLQEYPDIEEQVALGHIASYLGMTQETLSRLRRRRKKHQNS